MRVVHVKTRGRSELFVSPVGATASCPPSGRLRLYNVPRAVNVCVEVMSVLQRRLAFGLLQKAYQGPRQLYMVGVGCGSRSGTDAVSRNTGRGQGTMLERCRGEEAETEETGVIRALVE